MFIYFYINSIDLILQIVINWWHKRHEYEADAFAIELGYGKELESSLINIFASDLGLIFESEIDVMLNSTHPGLLSRLEAIDLAYFKVASKS